MFLKGPWYSLQTWTWVVKFDVTFSSRSVWVQLMWPLIRFGMKNETDRWSFLWKFSTWGIQKILSMGFYCSWDPHWSLFFFGVQLPIQWLRKNVRNDSHFSMRSVQVCEEFEGPLSPNCYVWIFSVDYFCFSTFVVCWNSCTAKKSNWNQKTHLLSNFC